MNQSRIALANLRVEDAWRVLQRLCHDLDPKKAEATLSAISLSSGHEISHTREALQRTFRAEAKGLARAAIAEAHEAFEAAVAELEAAIERDLTDARAAATLAIKCLEPGGEAAHG